MPRSQHQPSAPTGSQTQAVGADVAALSSRRRKAAEVLVDLGSFATTLLVLVVDRYGLEALAWHPTTVKMQLESDFNVELPRLSLDKIMAAATLVTTNYFYKSLSRFVDVCNVLAGDEFDPGEFNPADAAECAWGITEALLLSPPEEEEPFSDEVRYYVGQVLAQEGFVKPPDVLRIALGGDFTERVKYDFADDPEMFQAITETQIGKADDVTGVVRENLAELIWQLESLPLEGGDVSGLKRRLAQDVKAQAAA